MKLMRSTRVRDVTSVVVLTKRIARLKYFAFLVHTENSNIVRLNSKEYDHLQAIGRIISPGFARLHVSVEACDTMN